LNNPEATVALDRGRLAVEYVPVAALHTYHRNPRHGDIAKIATSLQVNGQYRALAVNRGTHTGRPDEVLAGSHTLLAARDLGWGAVAVTYVDVDDDHAARIVLADNRTADVADYDDRLLAELLAELPDLDGTGYDPGDLDDLIQQLVADEAPTGPTDADDAPSPPEEPVTRRGDVWELGRHRLLCGDGTNPKDLDDLLAGATPTLVHTDPPYGISIVNDSGKIGGFEPKSRQGTIGGSNPFREKKALPDSPVIPTTRYAPVIGDDSTDTARDAFALATTTYPKAAQVWWGGNHYAATASLPDASCWLVWDKDTGGNDFADAELAWTNHPGAVRLLRHLWHGMLRASERGHRMHPTQKPVALIEWVFGNVDPKGQRTTVLDLFAGSGSTLIAAERTARAAYVMELSAAYCDVICRRFQEHTGTVPTRDGEPHDFTREA
jgi:hypothetical protein